MIALLEAEFVSKRKWIEAEEFLDLVAIAESTPGPSAINAATYIGYKQAGFWGSFAAWFNDIQSVITLPERLHLGFTTLLLAHIAFNIPYVILNVAPKLRQMDKNLQYIARLLQ